MARKKKAQEIGRNEMFIGESSSSQSRGAGVDFEEIKENPGQVLVPVLLNGSCNYFSWKNSMIRALTAKDKIQFITEEEEDFEEDSPERKLWKRYDCLVTSWLLNSISKEIAEGFANVNSSKELWETLQHRFCENNGPLLYKLKHDINLIEQGDMTILQYFSKLQRLWGELLLLRPIPSCKCGVGKSCICNAFGRIASQDQEDRVIQQRSLWNRIAPRGFDPCLPLTTLFLCRVLFYWCDEPLISLSKLNLNKWHSGAI